MLLRKTLRRVRNWFFTGLVILAPLVLSIYFLGLGFRWLDTLLGGFAARTLGRRIPGLGLLASLLLAVFTGLVASNLVGRRLIGWLETALLRVPIFRSVYSTMKQVVDAFAGQKRTAFQHVVLVEYPRLGIWSIGFVTGPAPAEVREVTGRDLVNVLIATTPNPTSGFFIMVPREELVWLRMPVEDGLKLVISGGLIALEEKEEKGNDEGENGKGEGDGERASV
ncbi:MAG TPA: DUF502 domain-containing protein [Firmicutes bacterium]|nr:DUF502 domain-containing protein [Bacillota bacterium]